MTHNQNTGQTNTVMTHKHNMSATLHCLHIPHQSFRPGEPGWSIQFKYRCSRII